MDTFCKYLIAHLYNYVLFLFYVEKKKYLQAVELSTEVFLAGKLLICVKFRFWFGG